MSTSAAAYAYDSDLSETEYDFYSGITSVNGNLPMIVMEKIGNSYIIVSGETTFADYKNTYGTVSEELGIPLEGDRLVDQILNYCLRPADVMPPTIDSPVDFECTVNDTGNEITWTATDDNPTTYILYLDGFEIDTGVWFSGVPLTFSIDVPETGTYKYALEVSDVGGNTAMDSVTVTVNAGEIIAPLYNPLSWLISSGTIIGLVVYSKRKK